jgi:hypothetical protein
MLICLPGGDRSYGFQTGALLEFIPTPHYLNNN